MTIHLGRQLPDASRDLPGAYSAERTRPLFDLAPGGVCHATYVTTSAVCSYHTLSPLPSEEGGLLSVALSLSSRPAGVTRHRVPWSPDFPRILLLAAIRLSGGVGCSVFGRLRQTQQSGQ